VDLQDEVESSERGSRRRREGTRLGIYALFIWLISHQPAVLFSQNKPAISNQRVVLFSQNKPTPPVSHQPNEQAARRFERE
jgi:hypothetical protein